MPEISVYWQGREWTGEQWYRYQQALRRSDLDGKIEQEKQKWLKHLQAQPITITINGQARTIK